MSTAHLPTILPTPPPIINHGMQDPHGHHEHNGGSEHAHGHLGTVGGVAMPTPAANGTSGFFTTQPIDAGAEQGLSALRDSPAGSKPFYPYSTLIRYAIKGSPGQKLLLEDIYYAIEQRFPYFKTAPAGWKNSVRHNLSLNPCFEKVLRPLTDRGKGSYWVVNDNVDPRTGVHRIRKKKAPSRGGSGGSTSRGGKALTTGNPSYPAEYPVDHTGNGEYRYEGDQIANGATSEGYAHTYDPEHPSTYPLVPAHSLRYPEETGEEDIESEVDKHGNPNWRVIWVNELAKLQAVTTAQDGAGGDPDWYRMMIERLRSAFTVQAPPHPQGAFDAPEHTQPSTSAHLHVQPSTDPTL